NDTERYPKERQTAKVERGQRLDQSGQERRPVADVRGGGIHERYLPYDRRHGQAVRPNGGAVLPREICRARKSCRAPSCEDFEVLGEGSAMKAILLAAGYATRLRPLTDT